MQQAASTSSTKGRKKANLLGKIRLLLEFYFGDANLNKDRFLQEKLKASEEGYIPIATLLTFNKLRTLTTDENVVREAIKGTSVLVLSSDGAQVKRATPFHQSGPVDEKTLHVENLPEHADVDWVKGKFSAFGLVQYVSLPRYKSLKIKGFAFVEFGEEEAVARAIQYFNPATNPTSDAFEKEAALPVIPAVTVADFDEEELSAQHGHKRKRDEVMDEEDPRPTSADPHSSAATASESAKKLPITSAVTAKHAHVAFSPELLPLNVISKVEWLRLRKRYLDLQKASYRALKEKLKILSVLDEPTADLNGLDGMEAELASDDDQDMAEEAEQAKTRRPRRQKPQTQPRAATPPFVPTLEFLADVIIHVKLNKPAEDKKKIIADFRVIPHVAFVDVTSETEALVRLDAATAVEEAMVALQAKSPDVSLRLLAGEEEKTYWKKIQADMERVQKNRRGKAKILERVDKSVEQVARTHIKF
ncbi:putative La-related protein 7 [Hypsibius exemplaris]|uniref:La-related protein 7 n=1 Tax=Hypsibius exemplaris TaxID=2072580 RepID=A0A1W0XCH4_HYPEX|nr:putative La-related protein 7 [Hypsibius exemplaris]